MQDPQSLLRQARTAKALGRVGEAITAMEQCVLLRPDDTDLRFELSGLLASAGRHAEAARHLEQVARDRPEGDGAMINLANSCLRLGRAKDARRWRGLAFERNPSPSVWSARLVESNLVSGLPEEQLFDEHRRFERILALPVPPRLEPARRASPLKVGFVSADLRRHPVATFLEPVLEHLPACGVESIAFSNSTAEDLVTRRLRSRFSEWHGIATQTDAAVVDLVRASSIDVLVDLSGHNQGNRLGVFARRAAPIQATWLGYPNTTGLSTMDCRIVDEVTDPAGSERLATERLVRIRPPFVCYRPGPETPATTLPREEGPPCYGCFNFLGKLSEGAARVWSEVLRRDPPAILLLKQYDRGDLAGTDLIRRRFAAQGVDPDRIRFAPWVDASESHLREYRLVDVALDPFPYNGTTTTCEALWSGVPVVTLLGPAHRSRVGASLLASVGLGRLVAPDEDRYVEIAVRTRRDADELSFLRGALRDLIRTGPLGDAAAFTRRLAEALRSTIPG